MEIHIVQQGDNIFIISESYRIPLERLAYDNDLVPPYNLVIGQALIIAKPKEAHIVQDKDTLRSISDFYQVPLMQLLRNNSFLLEREFIYPGESLVISYDTKRSITMHGFVYPFVRKDTLVKTLPNLTYLSIFNYMTTEQGEIFEYEDDTEVINQSKAYGVVPLMLLTTLTPQGVPNIELAYTILLNEEYQDRNIDRVIEIINQKGYHGINIVFNYLNESNQVLYQNFTRKISKRFQEEGLLFFITINYKEQLDVNELSISKIDFSTINDMVNGMIILKFIWGSDYGPPAPVIHVNRVKQFINHIRSNVSSNKIIIGYPTIAYDWQLPYTKSKNAVSLSLSSVITLANNSDSIIQFDDSSQTPYFYYEQYVSRFPVQHIVWFIDVRAINSLNNILIDYDLSGGGVWNVMVQSHQLWTAINSTFEIIKLL